MEKELEEGLRAEADLSQQSTKEGALAALSPTEALDLNTLTKFLLGKLVGRVIVASIGSDDGHFYPVGGEVFGYFLQVLPHRRRIWRKDLRDDADARA